MTEPAQTESHISLNAPLTATSTTEPHALLLNQLQWVNQETTKQIACFFHQQMTLLYWHVGNRLHLEFDKDPANELQLLEKASQVLQSRYGTGFTVDNLRQMIHFAHVFSDETEVDQLAQTLSWQHIRVLLEVNDSLKRYFYIMMIQANEWSVNTLCQQIEEGMYERYYQRPPVAINLSAFRQETSGVLPLKAPHLLDYLTHALQVPTSVAYGNSLV